MNKKQKQKIIAILLDYKMGRALLSGSMYFGYDRDEMVEWANQMLRRRKWVRRTMRKQCYK